RLGPRLGELVWDVGAGSGTVAVECARLGAAVVAVEKAADGVERIRANAAAHADDVRVVHGSAPEARAELDDPDVLFDGGGGQHPTGWPRHGRTARACTTDPWGAPCGWRSRSASSSCVSWPRARSYA